jgi:hypothetical protein
VASEKGEVVSVEALREVLAELTCGAEGAEWTDTRAVQRVLRRVVLATRGRHAVLLPEATTGDAWDTTATDVTFTEEDGELRLEDEGATPVLLTPERLVMVTTARGPLLRLELKAVAGTPGAERDDGLLETVQRPAEDAGRVFRLVGGYALVVPHGFDEGRLLRWPGGAWWRLLQCGPEELRARFQ